MFLSKPFNLALLLSILLFSTSVNAGGGDDPDKDLVLSGVIERDNPLNQGEESEMIRYFSDRFFSEDGLASEWLNFDSLLKNVNEDIKKTGSEIALTCEKRTEESCVLLGNTIQLDQLYYIDEWSVCLSNTYVSAKSYIIDVIENSQLNDEDIKKLIGTRLLQLFNCPNDKEILTGSSSISDIDSPYYYYLLASNSLYKKDYPAAESKLKLSFNKSIDTNKDSWLSEALVYMFGRVSLLQAQKNWEGWIHYSESHEGLEEQEILNSIELIENYIKQYPNGQWVGSAIGLIGRANYFLSLIQSNKEDFKGQLIRKLEYEIENYVQDTSSPILSSVLDDFSKVNDINHIEVLTILKALLAEKNIHDDLASIQTEILNYLKLMNGDDSFNENKISSFKAGDIFTVFFAGQHQQSGNIKKAIEVLLKNQSTFEYKSDVNILIAKYLENQNGINDVLNFPSYVSGEYLDGAKTIHDLYLNPMCDVTSIEPLLTNNFVTQGYYDFNAVSKHKVLLTLMGHYLQAGKLDQAVHVASRFEKPNTFFKIDLTKLDFTNPTSSNNHLIVAKWIAKDWPNRYCQSIRGYEGETDNAKYAYYYLLSGLEKARKENDNKLIPEFLHVLTLCSRIGYRGYECGYNYNPYQPSKNYKSSKHWFRLLHENYPDSVWKDRTPHYY